MHTHKNAISGFESRVVVLKHEVSLLHEKENINHNNMKQEK